MGVTDFFKSIFTTEQTDNGNNLPAMTKRSDTEKNTKNNGTGNLVNQKLHSNNNHNSRLVSKNSNKLYETDEQLSRITSEDLPAFICSDSSDGSDSSDSSDFDNPIFDLDKFEIPSSPSKNNHPISNRHNHHLSQLNSTGAAKQDLTKIDTETISEGHEILSKAANVPDEILDFLTPKMAQTYKVLPVAICDNELMVLYADSVSKATPERIITNRLMSKKSDLKLKFYKADSLFLEKAIENNYLTKLGFDKKSLSLGDKWIGVNTDNHSKTFEVLDANAGSFTEEQNKYKHLFVQAVSIAHNERATDLDIDIEEDKKTGQTNLVFKINVDGSKIPILNELVEKKEGRKLGVVIRSLAGLDTSNDQDATTGVLSGNLRYGTRSPRVDLRCNVMPKEEGIMSFSIRIQTPDEFDYSPDNLGMYPDQQELMDRYFVRSVEGLALFVGATGSGKNTTQMTFLKKRMELFPGWKTITIEDPVEIWIKGVHQFSVKKNRGYDYFIPAAMRHVPNMLIVGETRDHTTAKLVLEASESGHLVSTTAHAGNCARAIEKMLSLGCDIHKLADSLKIIIAQKLVRKTCPKCVKVADPIAARIPRLKRFVSNLGGDTQIQFLMATGKMEDGTECPNCHGTGVKGRIGIFEIMTFNNEMRDLIINRAGHKIQECAVKNGMTSLWVNGLKRALTGEVSISSLERELGFPDPEREGLDLDRSMLSEVDLDEGQLPTCKWIGLRDKSQQAQLTGLSCM